MVGLARQVIDSSNRGAKAQAVLKLFATLSQAKWVTQQGLMEEWTAIYMGILQAGLLLGCLLFSGSRVACATVRRHRIARHSCVGVHGLVCAWHGGPSGWQYQCWGLA